MKRKKDQSLAGVRVLVGRAASQASSLSAGLRAHGAQVIEIPFIEIRKPGLFRPLDSALERLSSYDWLIFTSVNGVEAAWARLAKLGISGRNLRHLRIAAIGPATRSALEKRGVKVNVVPAEYVAESVVASLRRHVHGKRVLLARAKVARDVIPRELHKAGAEVDVVEAYETVLPRSSGAKLKKLLKGQASPDVITFTSSSTVKNFAALVGFRAGQSERSLLDGVRLASIGPVTSSTIRGLGLTVDIEAREYTMPGLIAAIVEFWG